MKKLLLLALTALSAFSSSNAFTIDEICGVYNEHTTGSQALSFLCSEYRDVDINNIVIISKVSDTKVQIYGFYQSPNAVKGTFDEANQTITFGAQKFGGTTSYYNLCKAAKASATINADGSITFNDWTISSGSDLYSKDMKTTFTPLEEKGSYNGTITAPGYYEGTANLRIFDGYYLLQEGASGYLHSIKVNNNQNLVFPWATVMYTEDPYCYIYDAKEADDLLMLGNESADSYAKQEGEVLTLSTPFQYYEDFSDEQNDNPTPNAQGTYTAKFDGVVSSSIESISSQSHSSRAYSLQGIEISEGGFKGVYIKNGKKFINK